MKFMFLIQQFFEFESKHPLLINYLLIKYYILLFNNLTCLLQEFH